MPFRETAAYAARTISGEWRMADITWEPPGKGPWELETTHYGRPVSAFARSYYAAGFARGFREGTARYGMLLDHLKPGIVNGFIYMQPVPFGAPEGAMKAPPALVLKLLTRVVPKMRKRIAVSAQAFANKQWRTDLKTWDEIDKPAAIARHREVQAVDVTALSDDELAAHIADFRDYAEAMVCLHHKYTATAIAVAGDLIAGVMEWTDASSSDVTRLLRGSSRISNGFAADELEAAAKAIVVHDSARDTLTSSDPAPSVLATLSADPGAGDAVRAYLDAVRYRSLGYDISDVNAGEMPEMLVGALRSAVEGRSVADDAAPAVETLRAMVPHDHLAEFDDRLSEARLVNRIRDERGAYSDGWATGLGRRALLEAGRRLASTGRLEDARHAMDLTLEEVTGMLRGGTGPSSDEIAGRATWRTTHTTADAPPFLRAMPPAPPPIDLLPPAARRPAKAVDAMLVTLFGVSDSPNTETVLNGLAVNDGVYEGTARLVESSEDFGRIKKGDVLVTRMTSPYFNVVLPLLGALVTDRGGQLSHAAIVAREYGIPGIVGTRDATSKIADGARVRVDGSTGEVRILG
jgi:pyruvate,water dikinase